MKFLTTIAITVLKTYICCTLLDAIAVKLKFESQNFDTFRPGVLNIFAFSDDPGREL